MNYYKYIMINNIYVLIYSEVYILGFHPILFSIFLMSRERERALTRARTREQASAQASEQANEFYETKVLNEER